MGTIRVARDEILHRTVAWKTILPELAEEPGIVRRFVAEAQITAQLEHPNIVPVYGLRITRGGSLSYAMKLIDGHTLAQQLREAESTPPTDPGAELARRLEVLLRVCDAVAFAHDRGVVHRDLKPANVMIGALGEVYVLDWGVARLLGAPDDALHAGQPIGTPRYMAPEQARGEAAGPAADQFALGAMLREIAGVLPSEASARVIARATAASVEERYPSVLAFAEDVRALSRPRTA
jgi:serine/threonine-protein kinase